ncbi:MAG: MBL fold metallo-hydrolase [Promethearchaeota archaeon]
MSITKITILIDDINGAKKNYVLSYGFAALIEKNNKKILFDTGTNVPPLLNNLKIYGISPLDLDAVILSHNHFDHTNGLPGILAINKNIPVYVHKDWNRTVNYKGNQVPKNNINIISRARECREICKGFFLTNSHLSSDYGGIHEQACYIKAESSYILICGCCHPGLLKFLEDRKDLKIPKNAPLHIIGGMHGFKFRNSEARELDQIIKTITLCHCTMNAKDFRNQFLNKCRIGEVGQTLIFNN